MGQIIDSACPSLPRGEFDLGRLAQTCKNSEAGFNITIKAENARNFSIWIAILRCTSSTSLQDAVDICEGIFTTELRCSSNSHILTFKLDEHDTNLSDQEASTFLLVITPEMSNRSYDLSREENEFETLGEKHEQDRPLIAARYSKAVVRKFFVSSPIGVVVLLLLTFSVVVLGYLYLSGEPARYERYPTPGSKGPKHQARLLWNNATAWAREVGFSESEWRIRIDDQALVPAHLYDESEERYQMWFRQRYPHLQEIVERYDYLRPSWLGSAQISVPWDEQFHFAHCVLALRRYWTAKESGTHVCGRDIDYAHMKHCLDSLDEKAFPPGPMEDVGRGYKLWWQTKVCYD